MSHPEQRDFQERVSEAFGSSRVEPLDRGRSRGPLDLLALTEEVSRRLRSSGGRPTDPRWEISRQVPFSGDRWQQLEELAAEISSEKRRVSPGQLAAMLVERGLRDYDEEPSSREAADGKVKDRFVFRIGEAFPSGSQVGCFLVSFSAGLNDLLFVNRLLIPEDTPMLAQKLTPGEEAYLLRASSAHVWELLELLKRAEGYEAVREFLDQLPPGAQRHLAELRAANEGTAHEELVRSIAVIRHRTWHYPRPDDKLLNRALRDLADWNGVLEAGEKMPTIRAEFADLIFIQFMTKFTGDDRDALGVLFRDLAEITVSFVHLAQYALDKYLSELPVSSVQRHPPGEGTPDDGDHDG